MTGESGEQNTQELWACIEEQQGRIEQLERALHRRRRLPVVSVVALAAASLLLLGSVAVAAIPDAKGVIHGCYAKKGGALRVVNGGSCASGEKALTWNQQGLAGPKGDRGDKGDPGPTSSLPDNIFCPKCDKSNVDLSHKDFTLGYFRGITLASSNLTQTQFNGADLSGASVARATVAGTRFIGTNLDYAYMTGVQGLQASFQNGSLRSATLAGVTLNLASFEDADLSHADLVGAYLDSSSFKHANIDNADFQQAVLTGVDFSGAHGIPASASAATYGNTTCPDGTNSDGNAGRTCDGHFLP